jgi:hypothetical protein
MSTFDRSPLSSSWVTLWTDGVHSCLLRLHENRHEVALHVEGRVMRRELCATEESAQLTAAEWRAAILGDESG